METLFVSLILFFVPIKEIKIKGFTKGLEKKSQFIFKEFYEKEATKENLDRLTERLLDFLLKQGYPFVRIRFTGFDTTKGGLKIIINVSNLKPVIIDDISLDKRIKTKKKIFYRYFPLRGKPFDIQKFNTGKEKIERFPFIEIKGFDFRTYAGKNYIYLDVKEKPSSSFEIFMGYNVEKKIPLGKLDANINNLFGDLRSFRLKWERFAKGKSDFKFTYTEPFIGPFELSLSPYYSLSQRESLYVKENIGLKCAYYLKKGNLSLFYEYAEEIPFKKKSKFLNSSGSEIIVGKKTFFPSDAFYFSISGKIIKGKNESYKGFANLFVFKNILFNFYMLLDFYAGGINLKDTLLSEYFYLGGTKLPRGYAEEEFTAEKFLTVSFENHLKFKNLSIFLFIDYSVISSISSVFLHRLGYGIGFTGFTSNIETKLSIAFPYRYDFTSAKIHLIFKNYF